MTLSKLAIIIGTLFSLPQVYALLNPSSFADHARKFPRCQASGYVLMALGTIWFLYNVNNEAISDFAAYKRYMMLAFGAVGVLTCIFVRDFLAVRGLAILLLLSAWYTLNYTRYAESEWRLLLAGWAYLWIIAGMWLTISPWRLRDFLNWMTADNRRIRIGSALCLALGLFVVLLGATAFRA